jgi:hypothetical protein
MSQWIVIPHMMCNRNIFFDELKYTLFIETLTGIHKFH